MSVGIVMLVHTALNRAEQLARHWSVAGCPDADNPEPVVELPRVRRRSGPRQRSY